MRGLIVVPVAAATLLANTPSASAHAALESTNPAKSAVVNKATSQVSMIFGEAILVLKGKNPNSISVTNPQGKIVSTGRAKISGMQISEALKTPLSAGKYTVKYRVVSGDGHVVTGSYNFTVK